MNSYQIFFHIQCYKRFIGEKLDQLWKATDILINECFHLARNCLVYKDADAFKDDILFLKLLPAFRDIGLLYLEDKNRVIREQIQELIRLEKHSPYTMSDHLYGKNEHI